MSTSTLLLYDKVINFSTITVASTILHMDQASCWSLCDVSCYLSYLGDFVNTSSFFEQ